MSKWNALIIAGLAAVASSAAARQPLPSKAPAAAATCSSCHGAHGEGGADGRYPRLAGEPAAYLAKQLHDFNAGQRSNMIMQSMAAGLSDRQIEDLARYYSRQQPPLPERGDVEPALLRRGRELVERGKWSAGVAPCASCHGPHLEGLAPDFPALAGQYVQYINAQLDAWQHGRRRNDPLNLMQNVARGLSAGDVKAVAAYLAWLRPTGDNTISGTAPAPKSAAPAVAWRPGTSFSPLPDTAIPSGPDGDMIRFGEQVFTQTGRYAKAYVGDALSCANCHLDRGRKPDSAPMWAAFGRYPRYREKNHKVNTLIDRIQGCFLFSMNGKPPPADSRQMVGLVSYFHWLASGAPANVKLPGEGYPELPQPAETPEPTRGRDVFTAHCALCHGDDGQGRESAGAVVFPPLWGSHSFNWGAGMHRVATAAAFIKANMPYGAGGSLSDQDAWDVAAYVVSQPRPQDPRFNGSVEQTKARYHDHQGYYGEVRSPPNQKEQ